MIIRVKKPRSEKTTKTMNKRETIPESPSNEHGECCEECKRTCKRNFWTEVLRTVVKIGTAVLAALGLAGFGSEE